MLLLGSARVPDTTLIDMVGQGPPSRSLIQFANICHPLKLPCLPSFEPCLNSVVNVTIMLTILEALRAGWVRKHRSANDLGRHVLSNVAFKLIWDLILLIEMFVVC